VERQTTQITTAVAVVVKVLVLVGLAAMVLRTQHPPVERAVLVETVEMVARVATTVRAVRTVLAQAAVVAVQAATTT
jgi:hypothetical protein